MGNSPGHDQIKQEQFFRLSNGLTNFFVPPSLTMLLEIVLHNSLLAFVLAWIAGFVLSVWSQDVCLPKNFPHSGGCLFFVPNRLKRYTSLFWGQSYLREAYVKVCNSVHSGNP